MACVSMVIDTLPVRLAVYFLLTQTRTLTGFGRTGFPGNPPKKSLWKSDSVANSVVTFSHNVGPTKRRDKNIELTDSLKAIQKGV